MDITTTYVSLYALRGKQSDSFAKYFSKHFDPVNNPPRCPTVREMYNFKILWKVNILNVMKDFGTDKCKLCTRERLILKKKHTEKYKSTYELVYLDLWFLQA